MRGDGSIFKRGEVYWISYSRDGKRFMRSARTADRETAERKLRQLRKAVERGEALGARERRVTVDELLDDLVTDLELRERPYAAKVRYHLKAVRAQLGDVRAASLETSMIQRYQVARRDEGLAPATINRECELLRQAYRLAARRQPPKVRQVPYVPLLRVRNARQGFLGRADVEALLGALRDPDIRDFLEWFWWTGMRPGEIRQLTWDMLDREAMLLTLPAAITKTGRPRTVAVTGSLAAIVDRRTARRRLDCPLIFQRRGRLVRRFTTSWRKALADAGLAPGLRPYDLRRSAIRNMVRAGVPETVAMAISGHRTRSTFDRYNITSAEDVRDALERTERYVRGLPTARNVASIAASAPASEKASVTLRSRRAISRR